MRNVMPLVRHRPMRTISGFTNLTVAWVGVLSSLIVVFYWFLIWPYPRYGFAIDLKTPTTMAVASSPWQETLSVYVDARGRFLVNGQFVKTEQLAQKLEEEFGKRVVWTVYVEADPNSSFLEAVYAMDAVTGLAGRVIWITPKTRREWDGAQEKPLIRVYYVSGPHGWRKSNPTR